MLIEQELVVMMMMRNPFREVGGRRETSGSRLGNRQRKPVSPLFFFFDWKHAGEHSTLQLILYYSLFTRWRPRVRRCHAPTAESHRREVDSVLVAR